MHCQRQQASAHVAFPTRCLYACPLASNDCFARLGGSSAQALKVCPKKHFGSTKLEEVRRNSLEVRARGSKCIRTGNEWVWIEALDRDGILNEIRAMSKDKLVDTGQWICDNIYAIRRCIAPEPIDRLHLEDRTAAYQPSPSAAP